MASSASVYFNTVLKFFYPDAQLRLNPLVLHFHDMEIKRKDKKSKHIHTVKSSFAQSDDDDDELLRTVVLIDIHTSHSVRDGPTQTTHNIQHFNLAIIDDEEGVVYLFEPLKTGSNKQISKIVEAHFPEHILKILPCHPQSNTKNDNFCMAYVCILATEILSSEYEVTVKQICSDLFAEKTAKDAKKFTKSLQKKIPLLPNFPTGAGDFIDNHAGGLVGGAAGLVLLGPVGLIGGIVLGDQLHDKKKRI